MSKSKPIFHKLRSQEDGFSILEAMITISIFGGILLICMAVFLFIGKVYYKGLYENRAQAIARDIVDSISEAIRTSGEDVYKLECWNASGTVLGGTTSLNDPSAYPQRSVRQSDCKTMSKEEVWAGYCVGNVGYLWQYNHQLDKNDSDPVFVRVGACDPSKNAYDNFNTALASEKAELLYTGMRVVEFRIDTASGHPNLYTVKIKLAYGGDEDDAEYDDETFVFDGSLTPPLPNDRSTKIIRCHSDRTFCAIAEMQTSVYKRIK